jgi:putative protease
VARLAQIGVDSLKIEGRTKSLYYVARTAQVYRRAIDDAVAGRPFNPELLLELEGLSNRGYTGGLLERRPSNDYQNYINGHSETQRSQYVGEILGAEGQADAGLQGLDQEWVQVETKNHFAVGNLLEVVHPSGNITVRLQEMRNAQGQPVQVAQGNPVRVWIPLPAKYAGALLARVVEAAPPAAAPEAALAAH